jgi:hypothetical protein
MSEKLRKVDYFYTMVPNTAGKGAKIMSRLAAEGVNLLAFSGFPSGKKAQLDLVPEDSAKLRRAAKRLGLKLSAKKTGFLVRGRPRRRDDRRPRQAGRREDQRHRRRRGVGGRRAVRGDHVGQAEVGRQGRKVAQGEVAAEPCTAR